MTLPFQISLALTIFSTGIAWVIQTIVYPMFAEMGASRFAETHIRFMRSLTLFVYLPMQMAFLATLGMFWYRPITIPFIFVGVLLALDVTILVSTFRRLSSMHYQLAKEGHNQELIEKLISFSWLRTIAWTLKSILLITILSLLLG